MYVCAMAFWNIFPAPATHLSMPRGRVGGGEQLCFIVRLVETIYSTAKMLPCFGRWQTEGSQALERVICSSRISVALGTASSSESRIVSSVIAELDDLQARRCRQVAAPGHGERMFGVIGTGKTHPGFDLKLERGNILCAYHLVIQTTSRIDSEIAFIQLS